MAALAGDADQVIHHRAPDAAPPRRFGRVHGLDLGVLVIEPVQRRDPEQLAVRAARWRSSSARVSSARGSSVEIMP